jgi:hypothetical protein
MFPVPPSIIPDLKHNSICFLPKEANTMKARFGSVLALCLPVAGFCLLATFAAFAQNQPSNVTGPSKYLFLTNESAKPGVSEAHAKNEAAMAQALREANSSFHEIALESITGEPRVIFLHGFDSFADLQKQHMEMMSNTSVRSALQSGGATDGSFLTNTADSIYKYREDLSLRAPVDLPQMRLFEIALYHVRAGHEHDFETLAKQYAKAFGSTPTVRWAVFQKMYGKDSGSTFIVATPMKSMSDVDQEVMDDAKLPSAVDATQLQSMRDLGSRTIESSESDLFAISREMSYVPASWATESPDFWGKK